MKKNITIIIIILSFSNLFSQSIVLMEEKNGVYYIPCKVNGISMDFVLDSGASDVTISLTEAKFLIKQGLLTSRDFIDIANYKLADGSIIEGTQINLSRVEIGGNLLENVKASIVHNQSSPLLLGLSAIKKLGPIQIENNKLIIKNGVSNDFIELEETFEWIFDRLNMWSYSGSDFSVDYFMKLQKNDTGGGYSLIGLRYNIFDDIKTEHIFALRISQIEKIEFTYNETNPKMLLMTLTATNSETFFVVDNEEISSKYSFILNKSMISENMMDRFTNAFENLIEINEKINAEKF